MSENNAPYIKKAMLKGYKSIKDGVEIDLLPGMNIIIGPNGSGKSNFLELVEKLLSWICNSEKTNAPKEAYLGISTRNDFNGALSNFFWKKITKES